jgi:hypothetical protein
MTEQERNERVKFMAERLRKIRYYANQLLTLTEGVIDKYNTFSALESGYENLMVNIKSNIKTVGFTFESACRELEDEDES